VACPCRCLLGSPVLKQPPSQSQCSFGRPADVPSGLWMRGEVPLTAWTASGGFPCGFLAHSGLVGVSSGHGFMPSSRLYQTPYLVTAVEHTRVPAPLTSPSPPSLSAPGRKQSPDRASGMTRLARPSRIRERILTIIRVRSPARRSRPKRTRKTQGGAPAAVIARSAILSARVPIGAEWSGSPTRTAVPREREGRA